MWWNKGKRRPAFLALAVSVCLLLSACGTGLTTEEQAAFEQLLPGEDLTDVTRDLLSQNAAWQEKFKAVEKIYQTEAGDWAVISRPIGYNGPITLAVTVDHEQNATSGLLIVENNETRHYVRGMEENWFTSRFVGKAAGRPLRVVKLEAFDPAEIVAITGATVSTQAVVNGVNAVLGLYG